MSKASVLGTRSNLCPTSRVLFWNRHWHPSKHDFIGSLARFPFYFESLKRIRTRPWRTGKMTRQLSFLSPHRVSCHPFGSLLENVPAYIIRQQGAVWGPAGRSPHEKRHK